MHLFIRKSCHTLSKVCLMWAKFCNRLQTLLAPGWRKIPSFRLGPPFTQCQGACGARNATVGACLLLPNSQRSRFDSWCQCSLLCHCWTPWKRRSSMSPPTARPSSRGWTARSTRWVFIVRAGNCLDCIEVFGYQPGYSLSRSFDASVKWMKYQFELGTSVERF